MTSRKLLFTDRMWDYYNGGDIIVNLSAFTFIWKAIDGVVYYSGTRGAGHEAWNVDSIQAQIAYQQYVNGLIIGEQ